MLEPKIIQLPDYSDYIGQEFIVTEDINLTKFIGRHLKKGVRFIIKNIKNSDVTIKISNSKQELEDIGMLDDDFNRMIKDVKSDIKIYKKLIKMWTDEPDKFIIDKDCYWNKLDSADENEKGHCINTGFYGIPPDHPDKYGMTKARYNDDGEYLNSDSIMTMSYKRTDDQRNIYSYQSGLNEFYSKTCYGFMLDGKQLELLNLQNRDNKYKKWVFSWIFEKQELPIKVLNKISFQKYEKNN